MKIFQFEFTLSLDDISAEYHKGKVTRSGTGCLAPVLHTLEQNCLWKHFVFPSSQETARASHPTQAQANHQSHFLREQTNAALWLKQRFLSTDLLVRKQQLKPFRWSVYLHLHLLRFLVADVYFTLKSAVLLFQRVDALPHFGRQQAVPLLFCNQLLGVGSERKKGKKSSAGLFER